MSEGNCVILTEKPGDCNCYGKAPSVPVCRDWLDHLPDCPAYRSGIPVGADSALTTLHNVMAVVQKFQPAGSPPPGGAELHALWTLETLKNRVDMAESTLRSVKYQAEQYHALCNSLWKLVGGNSAAGKSVVERVTKLVEDLRAENATLKAIVERREFPHAYYCFQHGGSEACEQANRRLGFKCPKCDSNLPQV